MTGDRLCLRAAGAYARSSRKSSGLAASSEKARYTKQNTLRTGAQNILGLYIPVGRIALLVG